ncbi:VOC family protein [Thiomicrospira microaerophila]|uniref:VOC family protein n=1 Tax=Thiomicrospira microaerophila TaxID=406020 RepID=UPI0005C8E8FD|nr:VOC family protein [Thiomicrospira microaerophila]
MAQVFGLDHVSVIVADAEKARAFYQSVLGLEDITRPDLGFPGFWLALGGGQTLHLMQLPNPYQNITQPDHGGRDRHLALRVKFLDQAMQKLDQAGINYTCSQSGRQALFFKDLDNNVVELIVS